MIDPLSDLGELQVWARIKMQRPPDFVIGDHDNPYLRRWWIVPRNPYRNVYLHEILRSDDDRAGHDHPWDNETLVIEGEYEEILFGKVDPCREMARKVRRAGETISRKAADTHRLIVPDGGRAITLFTTAAIVREWGFWCPSQRWVPWRDFVASNDKGQVGKGCGD